MREINPSPFDGVQKNLKCKERQADKSQPICPSLLWKKRTTQVQRKSVSEKHFFMLKDCCKCNYYFVKGYAWLEK